VICPALGDNLEGFEYQVDTSYQYYINNWYVQMDLVCANKAHTNTMLMPYYVGCGLAVFLFLRMPDQLGRKKTMVINLAVQLYAQFMAIYMPTYTARFIAYTLFGLTQLRATVVYAWVSELVESKYVAGVNSSLTAFDSATLATVCFFLLFVSKDIQTLFFVMAILASVALLICQFYMTESPKWLISIGQTKEAIKIFNYIAGMNKSKNRIPLNAKFKEEEE
jgi:MFS family permease